MAATPTAAKLRIWCPSWNERTTTSASILRGSTTSPSKRHSSTAATELVVQI